MAYKNPLWLNVLFAATMVTSGIFAGYTWYQHFHLKNEQHQVDNQLAVENNSYTALINTSSSVKYIVSPKGELSQNGLNTIRTANKVFRAASTYTSGKTYAQNIKSIKPYVTDSTFFEGNGFGGPKIDSSGDSAIDTLNLKSKTTSVNTYQINDQQYLVLVNHVMYHNKSTLDDLSNLKDTTDAFIVSGYGNTLNQIHELNGFTALQGLGN